jgi:hypothetical protein
MTGKRIIAAFSLAALLCACGFAQSTSGSIMGTVTDPSGAAVPSVSVELRNPSTGFTRTSTTGTEGIFRFNSLEPAGYQITIMASAGFKGYSQKDIFLNATENRDLGRITLTLGALTEEISVTALVTPVQTASSENSKLVDPTQVQDIAMKGRDLFGLLEMMPGVNLGDAGINGNGATANFNFGSVTINGTTGGIADGKNNFTVDGVRSLDVGSNGTSTYEPNMDTIAEIRVLTSNYQAEYGVSSGGTIAVVTKGGGREFHGSGWVNKRHEMFNANSFFNNYNGLVKSQYRFFVGGYSIGGPVAIPKLPNILKKKLFFFVSNEFTHQKPGTSVIYGKVPTPAQRAGNFAGYSDGNGKLYSLRDPTTGNALPNNNLVPLLGVVGDAQSATSGQAMLNFFPLPNLCNAASGATAPTGCITDPDSTQSYQRNHTDSFVQSHPRTNTGVRLDWNVTSRLSMWARYVGDADISYGNAQIALKNSTGQFVPYTVDDPYPGNSYAVNGTYTISPTMVNEITFGRNYSTFAYFPHDTSQVVRSAMGNPPSFTNFATDPQFVAEVNLPRPSGLPNGPQNFGVWVPAVSFGGGQEVGETGFAQNAGGNQLPYQNWYYVYTVNDALSKTWRNHNFKAGVYYDHNNKYQAYASASYLGSYSFGGSAAMPNDVQDGFGNAFLGNFSNYNEGKKVIGFWPVTSVEGFVQDTWRVSRRLTLDLGVRFYRDPAYPNTMGTTAVFMPSAYSAAQAERLYYPGCAISTANGACPTASQYSIDLATGAKTFYALNGTFVPGSGGGNPFPGMVKAGTNGLPLGLYTAPAFTAAPRFGFAWDVFGNGKTAVRGGIGNFLNRGSVDQTLFYAGQPPIATARNVYYTSISQVPSYANTAAISPFTGSFAGTGVTGNQPLEAAYNGSFQIQQNIGFSTVLEASWVFNLRRHIPLNRPGNVIPIYGEYNPSWASPMSGYLYANATGKDLNDNYFRPLPGIGQLGTTDFQASSDYHALQVNVRRNMTRHLSYGLAYTFAKTMSLSAGSPYFTDKYRNWQPVYSAAPHVLAINYVYEAPNLGQKLNSKALGWVTDHWSISGLTQWRSNRMAGVPGISFTGSNTTNNATPNWTGSAEGARMLVVGNPQLPSGQASFVGGAAVAVNGGYGPNGTPGNQLINESAFQIPYPCSYTPAATPQLGIGENMECFGNAGAGSIINIPNTRVYNFDMTLTKNFPLKTERRVLQFRAEMYNIFNHAQFNGYNIGPTYDWSNWKNGVLVQTSSTLGRMTGTLNPRQMSMSLRLQF